MRWCTWRFGAAAGLALWLCGSAVAQPLVLDVWPGGAAHNDHGQTRPERIRAVDEAPTPDATWVTNVTRPTISVFLADEAVNTGAAMIVCPGGGYWNLAIDKEGTEVAQRLASMGITGVVLKYRVPRRPGEPEPLPAPGPLLDAQRAVSLVRSHAEEWRIDPDRIGIGGFSAGGHLALMTATHFDQRRYDPVDAIDRVSCKPNFSVIAYTGYILAPPNFEVLADYIRFPEGTGPIFIVHASDDEERGAQPAQSLALYAAARAAGMDVEMHIYGEGKHGFGVRELGLPVSNWPNVLADWMRHRGIIGGGGASSANNWRGALPEGNTGIAARHPGDRGIGDDPAVLFNDDFERGVPTDRWDMSFHLENIRMADEPQNVHAGSRALEFVVRRQDSEVSNALVKRLGEGHDVVFLRYYSRFDPQFDQVGSSHNGGFLGAIGQGLPLATPGIKADGINKFIVTYENWRGEDETTSPGELNTYVYHPEQRSDFGDHFFPTGKVLPYTYLPGNFGSTFVSRPEITQELGRWYCYELMVKANTPGRRDGRIACWLDGRLIADFMNLRLRDTDDLKINHASIDLHIGSNRRRDNRKWYDDVVIATSYIGPRVEGE